VAHDLGINGLTRLCCAAVSSLIYGQSLKKCAERLSNNGS
jgi:hypothetical protein